jgi:hypothetical protein
LRLSGERKQNARASEERNELEPLKSLSHRVVPPVSTHNIA